MSFYFFLPLSLSLCQTSQDWNAARPYTGSLIVREDIYIYILVWFSERQRCGERPAVAIRAVA